MGQMGQMEQKMSQIEPSQMGQKGGFDVFYI